MENKKDKKLISAEPAFVFDSKLLNLEHSYSIENLQADDSIVIHTPYIFIID